jgi:hypothetical protein
MLQGIDESRGTPVESGDVPLSLSLDVIPLFLSTSFPRKRESKWRLENGFPLSRE